MRCGGGGPWGVCAGNDVGRRKYNKKVKSPYGRSVGVGRTLRETDP